VTFLDLLTPVVRGQRQSDAILFFHASDLVPHSMLLHKLSSVGFSDANVRWFRSYLTNTQSGVRVSGILSLPFQVMSGVPQKALFWGLFFSTYP
jgi:hypothetical protein